MPSLVEIDPVVLEKKIKIEKFTDRRTDRRTRTTAEQKSSLEIGPMVLEKKIFFNLSMYFRIRNYLPLEKGGPFI